MNLAKLVGLGIAVNEMVVRDDVRQSVVAFCVLCIMGAQVAEDVMLRAIDKIFSVRSQDGEE